MFYASVRKSKVSRVYLVPLAERPQLGANFGRVEAGVGCCWFDSLGVVFELHICRPLKARLVLLNEQYGVLQEDKLPVSHIKETHSARCLVACVCMWGGVAVAGEVMIS